MSRRKRSSRYKKIREIGHGGMGTVWEGLDTEIPRKVALKYFNIRTTSADVLKRRFKREARIQGSLQHEAILQLYDYCDDDKEQPFCVMQLVQGGPPQGPSLSARLASGQKFSFLQIFEIAYQLASAIEYLRQSQVIHRDLKSANVLVEDRGNGVRVLIADFGCAVSRAEGPASNLVLRQGTPDYWSPEQDRGLPPDFPMDVWGFGAVMHEVLTGRPPKLKPNLAQISRPDVPREFVSIVHACLEQDARTRLDAATLVARLRSIAGERPAIVTVDHSRATGREREMEELRRLLTESRQESRFALVAGPDGIGKGRLLDALSHLAETEGALVLRAKVKGDKMAPYNALCQVIEDHFLRAAKPADLHDIANDLVRHFPLLHHIRTIAQKDHTRRSAPYDKHALYALLAGAFRRMAMAQHTVIIIENIHNGTVSTEAIQTIAAQAGLAKLLLIVTCDTNTRNSDVDKLRQYLGRSLDIYSEIRLRPLTIDAERVLIAELLGSDNIAPETVTRIHAVSGSMPLVTSLLVKEWRDPQNPALEQDADGRWCLRQHADRDAYALPSLQDLFSRDVMRLPKGLRTLLEYASVAVENITLDELAKLSGRKKEALAKDVAKLVTAEFLREERPGRFAFSRRDVQRWVHDSLSTDVRLRLHGELAEYIEQQPFRPNTNTHGQLLTHYREARVPEKIREHGIRHAQLCLDGRDGVAAIGAADAVLEESDSDRTSGIAHFLRARGFSILEDVDRGLAAVSRAFTFFHRVGDIAQMCDAAMLAVEMSWMHHRMRDLDYWLANGIPHARSRFDSPTLARFYRYRAMSEALLGKDTEATETVMELRKIDPLAPARNSPRGTLRIPFGSALDSIDPTKSNLRWTADVAGLVFDTLTRIDDFGRVIPWLADDYRPSTDYRRYRFHIRTGVTFHNGAPCTARDVKWSLERLFRLTPRLHQMLLDDIVGGEDVAAGRVKELQGVQLSGDGSAVIVELSRPLPAFDRVVSDAAFSIVPYGMETLPQDERSGLAGTGPFILERFDLRREMAFRANPQYWHKGIPRMGELVITLGLTPDRIVQGFRNGQFSLAFDLTPEEHDRLRVDLEHGWHYVRTPTLSTCFSVFNIHRHGPLAARSAREALIAMIDAPAVAESVRGMAIPAYGLFPPALLEPDRRSRHYEETPLKGKLTAVCSMTFETMFPGVANEIVNRLKAKGNEVTLYDSPSRQFESAPEVDIYFGYFACDYPDLDGFALPLLHSHAGSLGRICGSETIDRLLAASRTEPRMFHSLYRDLHQHIVDEALVCPLFHPAAYCFYGPHVERVSLRNFFPSIRYEELPAH